MKKRIAKILGIIAAIVLVLAGGIFIYYKTQIEVKTSAKPGGLKELTLEEKLEDFNYMYKILKENHPYLETEKRKTGYDWLAHKQEFEDWIRNTKNNQEFYYAIDRMLYLVQNGHTDLIGPESYWEYSRLYSGVTSGAWNSVINDSNVAEKYKSWEKIINYRKTLLPLGFNYIEGNYVVTNPSFINENILNKYSIPEYSILKSVDGTNIDEYLKSIMDKKFLTYDYKRGKLKASWLTIPCDEGKTMKLEFAAPDGKTIERAVQGVEYIPPKGNGQKPDKLYDTAIIEEGKTAYIKVSSFSSFYVDKDRDGIHKFYEQIKDYPNLIIDIRGNGGGSENYYTENLVPPLLNKSLKASFYMVFRNGDYIKPFMRSKGIFAESVKKIPDNLSYPEEIKKEFSTFISSTREISPKNSVGFKGRIFLLVDSYVYSSAESFAVFAKSTGFATIVGTRTGGDGIGVDPAVVSLPNSGLLVRFPMEMGLNPDGTSNEETHTEPDVYVEQSYGDFIKYVESKGEMINPYDTVLNKVLEMTRQ